MNNIKVMVVDDSATVRQVLGDMLSQASGIEVIGTAGDPIFALRKMQQQWPDVVVLDVEMPRMDGLTFLKKLMAERPTPVVMCSTLTTEGSMTSLKALSLGAVEVIAKPQAQLREKLANSSRELVHAVRAAARANLKVLSVKSEAPVPRPKLTADAMLSRGPVSGAGGSGRLVAIGTSTGGTQALELVLSQLPSNLACPILAVQHMPEKFTAAFAKRLDSCCDLHIREAGDGDRAAAGQVLIAPGGSHMMVSGMQGPVANVAVKDGPLVSRHRPSVDVLFRSLAKINGRASMGIIMTGMGDDGAAGLKELRETGALTIGQDEATCVVYGMPAEANKRGAVQREVPLQQIAREIIDYAGVSANKLAAGQ